MKELGVIIAVIGVICTYATGFAWWAHAIWMAGVFLFRMGPKIESAGFPKPAPPPPTSTPEAPSPPKVSAAKATFFVYLNEKVKGPYTVDQIRTLLETDMITSDTPACRESDQNWKPLSNFSI